MASNNGNGKKSPGTDWSWRIGLRAANRARDDEFQAAVNKAREDAFQAAREEGIKAARDRFVSLGSRFGSLDPTATTAAQFAAEFDRLSESRRGYPDIEHDLSFRKILDQEVSAADPIYVLSKRRVVLKEAWSNNIQTVTKFTFADGDYVDILEPVAFGSDGNNGNGNGNSNSNNDGENGNSKNGNSNNDGENGMDDSMSDSNDGDNNSSNGGCASLKRDRSNSDEWADNNDKPNKKQKKASLSLKRNKPVEGRDSNKKKQTNY